MSSRCFTGLLLVLAVSALSHASALQYESSSDQTVDEPTRRSTADTSVKDIAFDLPDITVRIKTAQGRYHLEAFKSVDNDRILSESGVPRASQLIWVSVGQPTLVRAPSIRKPSEKKLFHLNYRGFYVYFDLLTDYQRKVLAATATRKYGVKVSSSQIVSLVLSKFDCSVTLYDDAFKKYIIRGEIGDFRTFPLRMNFLAPPNSIERKLLSDLLAAVPEDSLDMEFVCRTTSRGKKMMSNILSITTTQSEQIGLKEKLFGPSSSDNSTVYVSRDQISELSREMYATLNIVEDYEMPQSQFSEAFIQDFIRQTAALTFTFISTDEALKTLSTYTLDISEDLKPDIIKRDLGSILKVEEYYNKSRIVTDEAYLKQSSSSGYSTQRRKRRGLFRRRSISYGRQNAHHTTTKSRSLNDQLKELNTYSEDEVKWEFQGKKVVPKSLNVARLLRSNFDKTLTFRRVRIERQDAPFHREFMVYTHRAIAATPELGRLDYKVSKLSSGLKKSDKKWKKKVAALQSQLSAVNSKTKKVSTSLKKSNTYWKKTTASLKSQISSVSSTALRQCRVCVVYSKNKSKPLAKGGSGLRCSNWVSSTGAAAWTPSLFIRTVYYHYGNRPFFYFWQIDCKH